jgi:hypothetical protein
MPAAEGAARARDVDVYVEYSRQNFMVTAEPADRVTSPAASLPRT